MKKTKRCIIALAALAICAAAAGCNSKKDTATTSELNFTGYPISTDKTLTYWGVMDSTLATVAQNFGDTPLGKKLAEKTGINVQYMHPPVGSEAEQLSILLSTDDLPDIIENDWYHYASGPQKVLNEKILMSLNDVIDKYAPNLKKYLSEHEDINKMVVTDDKTYYVFPFIAGDDLLCVSQGIMVRQDWLDELGLDMPQTMDEWHEVLTAFKEKKGAQAPLVVIGEYPTTFYEGGFVGAYGVKQDFLVDDGKIIYGPADPRYKEFLQTFAQWYKEGLIEENLPNVDPKNINVNMLNGKSGVTFGYAGSVMGQINKSLKEKDPKAKVVPAPYPSIVKGEKAEIGQRSPLYTGPGSAGITTSCKNIELAARFLDFGYSEEGNMLYNFGIEGESYNMVDGYPTYTDVIKNNKDGLTVSQAMAKYIRASSCAPFVQRKEYIEQYYSEPEQKEALTVWGDTNAKEHLMPAITFTSEESEEISRIMTNIQTYMEEKTTTMILGKEDISAFDNYVKTMNDYGLEKVLEIYNAAYQRSLKR